MYRRIVSCLAPVPAFHGRRGSRHGIAACALAIALALCPRVGNATEIAVVVDPAVRPYVEALAGFQAAITANVRVYENMENGTLDDEQAVLAIIRNRRPDLVVAIGREALEGIAATPPETPVVFCMALPPHDLLARMPSVTGVTLAAAPEQVAHALRALFPGPLRVGTVYDPRFSEDLLRAARPAFAARGMVLDAEPAGGAGHLLEQVKGVLDRVDAYWIVPDGTIRRPDLLRLLVFSARTQRKVLIGPSKKFLRAGALLSVAPGSEAIGRQAAALSARVLAGTPPRDIPVQPAAAATLSIHRTLAREMGVSVPAALEEEVSHVP